MREKSLSLGQRYWRDGSIGQGGSSSGARRQKTKANSRPLSGLAPHCSIPPVFSLLVPKRVCLRFDFWHLGLMRRKNPSPF